MAFPSLPRYGLLAEPPHLIENGSAFYVWLRLCRAVLIPFLFPRRHCFLTLAIFSFWHPLIIRRRLLQQFLPRFHRGKVRRAGACRPDPIWAPPAPLFSAGANPSSLPSASRASASNSFKLGSSPRSLSPNRIKNSFDVLYKIGRPITSLRPAFVIKCLSSSVLITPEVFTPRISEISGEVTGCLYAITASVSSAGIDSLNGGRKLLMNRRTTSCCCGLVNSLYQPATLRISIPRSSVA